MAEYYYIVNGHKVRLLKWSAIHQKFLVEFQKGTAQLVAPEMLVKTDEAIEIEDEDKKYSSENDNV